MKTKLIIVLGILVLVAILSGCTNQSNKMSQSQIEKIVQDEMALKYSVKNIYIYTSATDLVSSNDNFDVWNVMFDAVKSYHTVLGVCTIKSYTNNQFLLDPFQYEIVSVNILDI